MEGYRPTYEYEPEIQLQQIDPQTPLGKEVWMGVYGDLEDDSFPLSSDSESLSLVSPEQIDQAIMGAIAGKNLGEVAALAAEDADDPVSQRMQLIGRRVGISLAITEAYTGVDGSWASVEPLPGSVAGTYEKGTTSSSGIQMDVDGILSEDWRKMIVHVLTHEATHLRTREMIDHIDAKGDVEVQADVIMTATQVIEAMTEKRASQLTGTNMAYHAEQRQLEELIGAEKINPIVEAFSANNADRVQEILNSSVAENEFAIELEEPAETIPEESLVGFRDSPVRERVMVAGREYEIASGIEGPNIAINLAFQYGDYLSDDDIEQLVDIEEQIQFAVDQAWATDEREVLLPPELQIKIDRITAKLHAIDLCEASEGEGVEFQSIIEHQGSGNLIKDQGFREGVRKWLEIRQLKRIEGLALEMGSN